MPAVRPTPAHFLIDAATGQYEAGRAAFVTGRRSRLHLRVAPGDVLWFADLRWPMWLIGEMVVTDVTESREQVCVVGNPSRSRWFPATRIGFGGAFMYRSFSVCPRPDDLGRAPVVKLPAKVAAYLAGIFANAPLDRPTCYCGECQQLLAPMRFRSEGFHVCRTCRNRLHHEWYGHRSAPLGKADWIACKAYFGNACAYCGTMGHLGQDHVVSVHRGGSDDPANVVPACGTCNSKKNDNDMPTWYRSMSFFEEQRLQRIYAWMGIDSAGYDDRAKQ